MYAINSVALIAWTCEIHEHFKPGKVFRLHAKCPDKRFMHLQRKAEFKTKQGVVSRFVLARNTDLVCCYVVI